MKTFKRSCLALLMPSMLAICQLFAACQARAVVITFNEFDEGTTITDQYKNLGAVFSGEPQNPQTDTPPDSWSHEETQSIAAIDSITIIFLNPNDGSPFEVYEPYFWLYATIFYPGSKVILNYYDMNDILIESVEWSYYNFSTFEIPAVSNVHKIVITKYNLNVWIDNLIFCIDIDADEDGHYAQSSCLTPNDDCDDSDPAIPGSEICNDGKDNDCDGKADCVDLNCSADLLCYPDSCASTDE